MIIEQIFLLGINEKSKKIFFDWEDFLFYSAIMMDLVLKDKISIKKDQRERKSTMTRLRIEILNKDSTDNTILDKMLQFIELNSEIDTFIDLLTEFVKRSNYSDFREVIISNLESLGLIKYLGKKRFKRRYQIIKSELKTKILDEINAVLLDNQEPTKELKFLLSLLRIEFNLEKIIPKNSLMIAGERILKLVGREPIGWQLQGVIDRMNSAAEDMIEDLYDD
ncbi:hypothetical protein LCGC14_1375310 [marine sediment metagenome]|uniref:Uncharacterized protein n=1 Tax=marine sediment metagenome TaxID=412755 RepID=A0A0F9KQ88_9ZZZZ